jgi:hypothetical protein
MKIHGIEGLSAREVNRELAQGARFVLFHYCISLFLVTFRRASDIYFVRAGESAVAKGVWGTVVSFFAGWWGIPWGPIYTIGAFITNFRGGKDLTQEVVAMFNQASAEAGAGGQS